MKKKRVLIVGGAGFIGHNLAIKLKKLKHKVSIVDSLQINNILWLKKNKDQLPFPDLSMSILKERFRLLRNFKIPLIKTDVRDYKKLSRVFHKVKPEIIIHLAAVSHANKSNKDPFSTFDHSLRTLENSLDHSKNKLFNVKQFIFLSSSMVYGNFKKKVVNEKDICKPLGIYAALKLSGENIIKAYNQVFGLPYTIIRPSALYGERCVSKRVGQAFIENALEGKQLTINGDGAEGLDFTYIDDLVQGTILAISKKEALNQIFNIKIRSIIVT